MWSGGWGSQTNATAQFTCVARGVVAFHDQQKVNGWVRKFWRSHNTVPCIFGIFGSAPGSFIDTTNNNSNLVRTKSRATMTGCKYRIGKNDDDFLRESRVSHELFFDIALHLFDELQRQDAEFSQPGSIRSLMTARLLEINISSPFCHVEGILRFMMQRNLLKRSCPSTFDTLASSHSCASSPCTNFSAAPRDLVVEPTGIHILCVAGLIFAV
jgi:hypothetical protein